MSSCVGSVAMNSRGSSQFQVALVEHADLAVGIHLPDTLRTLASVASRALVFTQQRAGAHQLGVHLAPVFFGLARHFPAGHGAEQRLRNWMSRTAVAAGCWPAPPPPPAPARHGWAAPNPSGGNPSGQRLATGVGAGVLQDRCCSWASTCPTSGVVLSKPCLLKAAHGLHARGSSRRMSVAACKCGVAGHQACAVHGPPCQSCCVSAPSASSSRASKAASGLSTGNEHRLRREMACSKRC